MGLRAVVWAPSEALLATTKEIFVVERLLLNGRGVILNEAVEAKLHQKCTGQVLNIQLCSVNL